MHNDYDDLTTITRAAYRMRNKVIADMIRSGWNQTVGFARNVMANAIIVRVGRGHHSA